MDNMEVHEALDGVIHRLTVLETDQQSMDDAYGEFCDIVVSEMEKQLPHKTILMIK